MICFLLLFPYHLPFFLFLHSDRWSSADVQPGTEGRLRKLLPNPGAQGYSVFPLHQVRPGEKFFRLKPAAPPPLFVGLKVGWLLLSPLFYRQNRDKGDVLYVSDKKHLRRSHLNRTNPLVIYMHGFSERAPGGEGESSRQMKEGEFKRGRHWSFTLVCCMWYMAKGWSPCWQKGFAWRNIWMSN